MGRVVRRQSGEERVAGAVKDLRAVLPFDAVQLLRHDPRRAEVHEALRLGYGPADAWALRGPFVARYGLGFTSALSADGLPLSISTARPHVREEFVRSAIYRDHLEVRGFLDGMSMELFLSGDYVGIAHFSAFSPHRFTTTARRAAASVGGLLAALIAETPTSTRVRSAPLGTATPSGAVADDWYVHAGRGWDLTSRASAPSFLATPRFLAHLDQFRSIGFTEFHHLWDDGKGLHQGTMRRLAGAGDVAVGIAPVGAGGRHRLSRQELRVLALLCTGRDDAGIARALHLNARTVESHVLSARRKLEARNRVEAVVRVLTTASFLPDPHLSPITDVFRPASTRPGGVSSRQVP